MIIMLNIIEKIFLILIVWMEQIEGQEKNETGVPWTILK